MLITRKVFTDLAIWMTSLGLMMGVMFPFFVVWMGIPAQLVMTPWFFATCMTAGLLVGAANIMLAKTVVGRRLRLLVGRMLYVKSNLIDISIHGDMEKCTPEKCFIKVDSEDEMGESASAFNQLVETLVESLKSASAVRTFNEMLTSQLELHALTEKALDQLLRHTNAIAGAILVEKGGELRLCASYGIHAPDKIAESELAKRALNTKERQFLAVPGDVIVEGALTDFRPKEIMLDPIVYKNASMGVVALASATGFTNEDRNRLDLFRQGLALAIHNALIHASLQKLAAVDPLTNVFNRRFGLVRLHEEYGRSVRTHQPLGVMMGDIDHFKKINDIYGHLVGDRILMMVAKTARSALREGDIVIRYGGEEFLFVLPAASRNDVLNIAERFRHMVEDSVVREGMQDIRVTISIGGTSYPEFDVQDEIDLIKNADQALYMAKDSGRDRTIMA